MEKVIDELKYSGHLLTQRESLAVFLGLIVFLLVIALCAV